MHQKDNVLGMQKVDEISAEQYWETAFAMGYPAALWRLPLHQESSLIISFKSTTTLRDADLDSLPSGFMICPFSELKSGGISFIEGDLMLTISADGTIIDWQSPLGFEHPDVKKFLETCSLCLPKSSSSAPQFFELSEPGNPREEQSKLYQRKVEVAVAAIKSRQLSKVVLSRQKEMGLHSGFRAVASFFRLTEAYPSAFISLFNLPETKESWLGASPELLVGTEKNGKFRTMALAGTQRAMTENGELIPKYGIRWGQKEIEEQALVSRYIIECFKKIRLREYIESGPKTVLAGNLYHLQTDFEVDTKALNFPELGTTMLRLLHPTSAVCGTPKEPALQIINSMEGYDRSFYSGYLGPVNIDGDSNLFVNLRTMQLKTNKAIIYAGGGITEDSDPGAEWEETELKCETLLNALG